jgi:hypothetical protein
MIAAMAEHKKKRRENIEDQRLFMEGVSWDFVS